MLAPPRDGESRPRSRSHKSNQLLERSVVRKIAAAVPFGLPQAMTSSVEANRRTRIVLWLVLYLCSQDRLSAHCARLTGSVASPNLHGVLVRQRACIELVAYEIGQ